MDIHLDGANGKIHVVVKSFPALVGWEMQHDFVTFIRSTDRDFRRQFTFAVLEYACVIRNGIEQSLKTDALVNNNLERWENVQAVFNAVLEHNGIEPQTFAAQMESWANEAGSKLAIAFIAAASDLMGPALENMQRSAE